MWRGEPSNATDVDFYVVDFQAKYASGVSSVYDIKQMFLPIIEPKFNRIVMRQEIVPVNKTMPEKSQEKAAEKRAVSTKNKKNKNTFKNKGKTSTGAKTANTQSGKQAQTSGATGDKQKQSSGATGDKQEQTSGATSGADTSKDNSDEESDQNQPLGPRKKGAKDAADSGYATGTTIDNGGTRSEENEEKKEDVDKTVDLKDVLSNMEFEIVGKVKITNGDAASDKEVTATISSDRGKIPEALQRRTRNPSFTQFFLTNHAQKFP